MKYKVSAILFTFSTIILLSDFFSDLEITSSYVLSLLLFISLGSLSFLVDKIRAQKSLTYQIISMIGVLFLCLSVKLMYFDKEWKTQTILYTNGHFSNKTIEFQMKDLGSAGYKKRTIEKTKLLPFLSLAKKINPNTQYELPWIKVDNDVNELGLKH